jgi:hypothetical protein
VPLIDGVTRLQAHHALSQTVLLESRIAAAANNKSVTKPLAANWSNAAGQAKLDLELVGRWDMIPNNHFLPKKTLTIEADADYFPRIDGWLDLAGEDERADGTWSGAGQSRTNHGAQMMLYDETSGQILTMWYEFTDAETMEITEMDSTKYQTKRQRVRQDLSDELIAVTSECFLSIGGPSPFGAVAFDTVLWSGGPEDRLGGQEDTRAYQHHPKRQAGAHRPSSGRRFA